MTERNFVVIYDGVGYCVTTVFGPDDAAIMACNLIWDDTGGEAFDLRTGKPTPVEVRDDAGEITHWDVYPETHPTFQALTRGAG